MASVIKALEENSIYVVFQPVIDLLSKTTYGYEVLVRSSDPELPHPGAIIDTALAEEQMGQLGRRIRALAIEGCNSHPLFVNIHPNEFDTAWLIRPDDGMNSHEHDVYLEITESVPLSHYKHCHSVLSEVRQRGVRVAVDDLGAGYSNLKYISDLEPEIVKLDRGLVAGVQRSSRQHRLLTAIVDLCRSQGARVVVEGIETLSELRAVLETGAHYAQGYFFQKPVPELVEVDWHELMAQAAENDE